MAIKRPKGYCPACEAIVEFYSDALGGNPNFPWRCGNCFQGFHDAQLTKLETIHQELEKHELARQKLLDNALRDPNANPAKNR